MNFLLIEGDTVAASIGVEFEKMFDQMRMLATQVRDFPQPAALQNVEGADTGAAQTFNGVLTSVSRDLMATATAIRAELELIETRLRDTAADMSDADGAAADGVRNLLTQLEGIPDAPVAAPTVGAEQSARVAESKGLFK